MWACKFMARPLLSLTANVLPIAESNRCTEDFQVSRSDALTTEED
jgi:hypothetical protein